MSEANPPPGCPTCGAALEGEGELRWCPGCALGAAFEVRDESAVLFRVPGHDVLVELGRGAAGIVYRARQENPAREVALKILRPHERGSAESLARFRLEAATVAALDHPVILPVWTVGEQDGLPYFTMKLCRGSLAERVGNFRERWRETAELVARLAEAVQHAHARGVLHRDLKPGNVLFDEAERPFISDFGLAKLIEAPTGAGAATRPLLVMGTPGYMAPEVLAGGAGAATTAADVFALGAMLHELLTGAPPPAGAAASGARRVGVPRDLAVICGHALAAEPGKRYATAEALAQDLRAWLAGRPIAARPVSAWGRGWSWARRNPALAVVSAALLVALVAGAMGLTVRNRQLRVALEQTLAAEAQAQASLADALIAQARAVRQSGWMGQRYDTLGLLARAGKIAPGLAVRSEAAAALARPDVRIAQTLPIHAQNSVFDEWDFSPDLEEWATGVEGGGLALRQTSDGAVIRVLPARSEGLPWFVRFGGDDRHVLAQFDDERLHVWDRTTGELRFTAEGDAAQRPRAALHPRLGRLAWVDASGALRLRELADGTERVIATIERNVRRLSFSSDGGRVALVTDEGLQVWDVNESRLSWRWEGALSRTEPAWSGERECVAVSQLRPQQEIVVLDGKTGALRQRLPADSAIVGRLAFFPGGRILASVETIGELTLWDWEEKERLVKARTGRSALRVARDGRRLGLAVSFQELGIMEVAPDAVVRPWQRDQAASFVTHVLCFSGDGRQAATVDRSSVRLWDVAQAKEIAAMAFPAVVAETADLSMVFEPAGGGLMLTLGEGEVHRLSGLGSATPKMERITAKDGYTIRHFAGADLLVDSPVDGGRVELWPDGDFHRARAVTGRAVASTEEWGTSMVSPDGRWVATAPAQPGHVQVWDASTAGLVARLPISRQVGGGFSPDGRWLVLGTDEGYTVYRTTDWQEQVAWPIRLQDEYRGWASFSPDGRWLALLVGSRTIELRETVNFKAVVQLELTRGPGRTEQAWSPDSTRFCIATRGHLVFEWNLPALAKELAALGLELAGGK